MAGVCITCGEIPEIHIGFWWGHLKGKDNMKYIDVDDRIILKFISQK